MNLKSGQTFALVHLIELVLAVLVIAVVGLGLFGMINGIQFYEQYYARDSAYMLETMQAVPNGNLEYGYLWASPDYNLTVQPGAVTVVKANPQLGGLIQGRPVTKAYGQGRTTIESTAFKPQYFVFSLDSGRNGGADPTTATPRASVKSMSAARTCPEGAGYAGIAAADGPAGDAVGKGATDSIVQEIRALGSGGSGLRVTVTYEAAPDRQISVINRANTELTTRVACVLAQQSAQSGIAITQTTLSAESPRLQSLSADIIIIMRGRPEDVATLKETIITGLADSRGVPK